MTGKIKLVHSGGNSVSIAVPTSAPSASPTSFKIMSMGNTFHTGGMKSVPVYNQSGTRFTIPIQATTVPIMGRTDLGHDSTIPVTINPA